MTSLVFSKIVSSVPKDPGIYKYFDDTGELLYVGKAKNIKTKYLNLILNEKINGLILT